MVLSFSLSSGVSVPYRSSSCVWKANGNGKSCRAPNKVMCSAAHRDNDKKPLVGIGVGAVAALVMGLTALDADATRIEYYATVGEPPCELNYVKSGLGYCDVVEGFGEEAPLGELINVSFSLTCKHFNLI